ncbi:MAG: hypothetical protein K2M46_11760 [Lachnospiraceae bacterium]|nr:hypothetical protein [Lachnospiraceae bacterium]
MEKFKWKKVLEKSKRILAIVLIACIVTGIVHEYRSVQADNNEQTENLTAENSLAEDNQPQEETTAPADTVQDTIGDNKTGLAEQPAETKPEETPDAVENTEGNPGDSTQENETGNTNPTQPVQEAEEPAQDITPVENEQQEEGDIQKQLTPTAEGENGQNITEIEGEKPTQQPSVTAAENNPLDNNSTELNIQENIAEQSQITEETIEEPNIMSTTATKTIYFDTVKNGAWSGDNNGWTKDCNMYIFLMDTDNSQIRPMTKSAKTNTLVSDSTGTLWEYTITEAELAKCTGIIFINRSSWGDNSAQTTDILMSEFKDDAYPCFVLTDQASGGKKIAEKIGNLQPADFAGKKMYLYDMTSSFSGQNTPYARFTGTGAKNTFTNMTAVSGKGNLYEVTIPADESDMVYTTIEFCKDANTVIASAMDYTNGKEFDPEDSNTYYYGATKLDGDYLGYWDKQNTATGSLTGLTLYFDNLNFPVTDGGKLKIGSETVDLTTAGNTSLSYEVKGSNATQQTMLTFIDKDKNEYNFFWRDLSKNQVNLVNNFATIARTYNGGVNKIYFDATLSKLHYNTSGITPNGSNGAGDYGMPNSTGKLYYYMTGAGKPDLKGEMAKEDDFSKGSNTFTDVYSVDLEEGYTNIVFASFEMNSATNYGGHGESTTALTIPSELSNPCFYADTSDMVIYDGGIRGGYWDEVYTIRNPEQQGKQSNIIVDIPSGTEVRDTNKLYVNTTFYDFYTDYELNGKNRDTYNASRSGQNDHRIYQPFRQFNQALSDYYTKSNVSSPLYWGNFQNYTGSPFYEIAGDLNLFGYGSQGTDLYKKFFYENNSMWGRNGNEINNGGENAVQGLVSDTLSNGSLMMKTASGTVPAPFVNESFLAGNNTKNTTLGKVYKNVSFPFNKQSMKSRSQAGLQGEVDYWVFDSKDASTNRRLTKDNATGHYFLQESDKVVKGITTFGITQDGNFFPFNGTEQSGNSALLNYGFAMKMEVSFRLTEDGRVINSQGEQAPIEFNFSGDDDIWVFIDGKLALDIGGGHGIVSGYLDFSGTTATKKAYVSGVKDASAGSGWTSKTNNFTIAGSNTDTHTLTMFYQERGIWESNMYVSFNFPDENTFQIEKQIDESDVNQELFSGVFDSSPMFPFTIRNQATHYGSREVDDSDTVLPVVYNDNFNASTISKTSQNNTFEKVSSFQGRDNVVKWRAKYDDLSGTYKEQRMGVIAPAAGGTLDLSKVKDYLSFQYYYDEVGAPSLNYLYIQLEDGAGNTLGGYINGKTHGVASMKSKAWATVTVDLSKLSGSGSFNYSQVKSVKFAYNKEATFYLDDFTFLPKASVSRTEGFTTNQRYIADYGSAKSGQLEYPEGAIYNVKKSGAEVSDYMRIGSDGIFVLSNGETAIFTDQFRRGSYISLQEDVDTDVFETSYTIQEDGQPVSSMASGNTIILGSKTSLVGLYGAVIDDGRTEVSSKDPEDDEYQNKGYPESKKPQDNTMVYRSYSNPDMLTGSTKLGVTYTNKVKTGSLTIKKEQAEDSDDLEGSYTFKVTFNNVAGMGLEGDKIITKTITLKTGESETISGIPINTSFMIVEETPEDESELVDVTEDMGASFIFDNQTKVVEGSIQAARQNYSFTFINTKNVEKPVIDITLQKLWKNSEGNDLINPKNSINVSLQRREKGSTSSYVTVSVNGKNATTIRPSYTMGWTYTFENQDRYVDYKAEPQVEWEYRVVELDNNNQAIEQDGFVDSFKVSYASQVDASTGNVAYTITNTYQSTNIQINKVDATDENVKLSDVEFTLEKLDDNGQAEEAFTVVTKVTTVDGIALFEDLQNGIYRITETKAKDGYNLLKNPITVVIDRDGICKVDEKETQVESDTLKITVSNKKKFQLPFTGGYGRTVFIIAGICLLFAAAAVYVLKKNNKLALIKGSIINIMK